MKNKKGVVLVIASVVILVVTVLTSVYMTSMVTEKRSVDNERYVLQALNLAEAGANQAITELRKRILIDLKARVILVNQSSIFNAYVTGNSPLGLIRDYAYASGQTQFTVASGLASLTITPVDLNTAIDGNFATTTIKIQSTQSPVYNSSTDVFTFYYVFSIESTGKITKVSPNITKTIAFSPKTFSLVIRRDNFAKYALFTSVHTTPSGTLVWFTQNTNFTGPVHTNSNFNFANNPSGTFTEDVTQANKAAGFYNNGNSKSAEASAYPVGCTTACVDKPVFNKNFLREQTPITLPTTVTQTQMASKASGGTTISSNGIWLPKDGANNLIGGIYIKGGTGSSNCLDNPTITMSVDGSNRPVYTITRSSNTKQIVVDYVANQTVVTNIAGSGGTAAGTYSGTPNGSDHLEKSAIIYTNDDVGAWSCPSGTHWYDPPINIDGLSGTVQQDTQVTVASATDLMITDNVIYQKNPTIVGNEDYDNMLGIISWAGNVRIGVEAPNNININAVVMAPGTNGIFTVDDYNHGSPRGTAIVLGGAITYYYGAFGTFSGSSNLTGYGRNFIYDSRVLDGKTPPYFPYMVNYTSEVSPTNVLYNKLIWREK